jgi:hypothetical protein
MNDKLKLSGWVIWELRNAAGVLLFRDECHNLVVDEGLELIASLLIGGGTAPSHMAIGSDGTAPDPSDSALGTELARVVFTSATVTDNVITWVGTFGPGVGTGTVQEAGIFNDGTTGDMLCRTTHGAFVKAAGDTLTITWDLTLSDV